MVFHNKTGTKNAQRPFFSGKDVFTSLLPTGFDKRLSQTANPAPHTNSEIKAVYPGSCLQLWILVVLNVID